MRHKQIQPHSKSWFTLIANFCTRTQTADQSDSPNSTNAAVSAIVDGDPVVLGDSVDTIAPPDFPNNADSAPRLSIGEISTMFNTAWYRQTRGIFAIAKICAYIRENYNSKERRGIIKRLPIDRPRLEKLAGSRVTTALPVLRIGWRHPQARSVS